LFREFLVLVLVYIYAHIYIYVFMYVAMAFELLLGGNEVRITSEGTMVVLVEN
jgi:hypothetical protein